MLYFCIILWYFYIKSSLIQICEKQIIWCDNYTKPYPRDATFLLKNTASLAELQNKHILTVLSTNTHFCMLRSWYNHGFCNTNSGRRRTAVVVVRWWWCRLRPGKKRCLDGFLSLQYRESEMQRGTAKITFLASIHGDIAITTKVSLAIICIYIWNLCLSYHFLS